MRVVLDTNALMAPVEVGVRTFEELDRLLGEYDAVVPEAVLSELDRLAGGAGEAATAASVGSDLARRECETVEHGATYADDAVVEIGRRAETEYAVTSDMPLRERLLEANVPVICLRGRTKFEITEP
ncbi:twitching motility protein PilT [Natronomonas sp. F2-12]|uniref:Twitching motility protein PilT n=1 Tax=Natronomonas aquatica TaxID=2841590 RepID=A0A9R1D6Y2_9EURY|nr:PIN domain-containing protein [Natronomonas aquatica]MCQ4333988.1 twitching motility protein PilT [Natronomonas aquatica]